MASISPVVRAKAGRLAPPTSKRVMPKRALLLGVVAAAAVAGFVLPSGATASTPPAADMELTQLLRMMALLKLALVAGAAWLVDWRLRQPVEPRAAWAYLTALGAMAAGPGLIWNLTHMVLGAVLLHAGLVLLTVLVWKDEDFRVLLRRRS